ncbi:MAG: hypothetical protein ACJASV_002716 [Pseudorhodobacter sp.]
MLAACVAFVGLGFAWLALDFARMIVPNLGLHWHKDYVGLAVLLCLVMGSSLLAWRLANRPFGVTSAISFDPKAITFERWGVFGGHRIFTVPRNAIAAVWRLDLPRSPTLGFELTHDGAVALNLQRSTTKTSGVLRAAPKLSFHAHGFELGADAVIAAQTEDLAQAGFHIGVVNEGRKLPVGKHWRVTKAPPA